MTGTPGDICTKYPEIDQWAGQRNLDPMLVRAIVYTESNFKPCAAARVCSKEYKQKYGTAGCFQKRTDIDDECYGSAYDAMYDPAELCPKPGVDFDNDPTDPPGWRYCALGIMQSLEPPYTFWPAAYTPDGKDGQYVDIYKKASMSGSLAAAKACDPKYNPFNVSHALCMGTALIEAKMESARTWVSKNHRFLNWPSSNYEKENMFIAYVAMNKYAGFWDSTYRINHPICPKGMKNGDCWADRFLKSWTANESYCTPAKKEDPLPPECKSIGVPDKANCYGYKDFVSYVNACEIKYLPRPKDPGASKMSVYYWLTTQCENSFCPDGFKLMKGMNKPIPSSGTPYIPDKPVPTVKAALPPGGTATVPPITVPASGITPTGT
jgi:hypothetical protein